MKFFDNLKEKLSSFNMTLPLKYISTPIGMYIVWILLHYAAAHLYKMHCAASGLWGFLLSPLMASTPYCTGLVWILQHSVIKFMAIWTIVGSWISLNLNRQEIIEEKRDKKEKKEEEKED
jgi:hypothetical protein